MKTLIKNIIFALAICLIIGTGTVSEAKSQNVYLKNKNVTLYTSKHYNTSSIKVKKKTGVKLNKITYKALNKKIKVSKSGKVTALKSGTSSVRVTVRYTIKGVLKKKILKYKITIKKSPKIQLNKKNISIKIGETANISLKYAKGKHVTFYCDDSSVFDFKSAKDNTVTIIGVGEGEATLRVTCEDKDYYCNVIVTE